VNARHHSIVANKRCQTTHRRKRCVLNVPDCIFVVVLLLCAAAPLSVVVAQDLVTRTVKNKVKDVFVPAEYGKTSYSGYLAERMKFNIDKRLITLNLEPILSGYEHRPGVQTYIGEHVGKFLHASTYAWRFTGEDALKQRMDYAVSRLLPTQLPDGYLGTYLDKDRWTEWDVWSHKYNLIGLETYYEATGHRPALEACKRMADLLCNTFGKDKRDIIATGQHVGMASTSVLEPMARLYRLTGNKRYLDFCHYIIEAWDEPNGPKVLTGLLETGNVYKTANAKAYEMLSNLVGLMEMYRIEGDPRYLKACQNAWNDITTRREYPIGTASVDELFSDDFVLPSAEEDGGPDIESGEGCVTTTWLQLNMHLLQVTGNPKYAAKLERIVYNALIGAQSPHTGQVCYFTPENGIKRFGERNPGLNYDISCCASSLPRGIALIPEFVSGALEGNPAIFQYVAGTHLIHAQIDNKPMPIQLLINTDYPNSGTINIKVDPPQAMRFPLLLRVPTWADAFVAKVGGKSYKGQAGKMLTIARNWKPGDMVNVTMDMTLRVIPDPDRNSNKIVFLRGPQVLAEDKTVDADGGLPTSDWWGDQCYTYTGKRDGKEVRLILVPFAEAGQNKDRYTTVFEDLDLDPSIHAKRAARNLEM